MVISMGKKHFEQLWTEHKLWQDTCNHVFGTDPITHWTRIREHDRDLEIEGGLYQNDDSWCSVDRDGSVLRRWWVYGYIRQRGDGSPVHIATINRGVDEAFFSTLLLFAFMEISWIEDEEEISRERAAAFMAPWRWRTSTFMYQKIAPVHALSSCSGIVIWCPPNSGGFQSDQMLIDFAGWHGSKVYRDPSLFGVSLSVFKLQGVLQAKLNLLLDVLTSRSFVACFVLCCITSWDKVGHFHVPKSQRLGSIEVMM